MFLESIALLTASCLFLIWYSQTNIAFNEDPAFRKFQKCYLIVYFLAVAGDWLQGPHVYALYASYGMSVHQIEVLFVAGFGSSLVFGTFIGSIADKYGRRNNCLLYGILYGLGCLTKHFNNIYILMVGRFLGGIATSILFSAFESWLIYEHVQRGFSTQLLGTVFSNAVLGNSVMAILAGFVAQVFADQFGFVAPFDVSLVVLVVMCIVLLSTWSENYGDSKSSLTTTFKKAVSVIRNDRKIICLGLIQALFEGAMYIFILEWTPALTVSARQLNATLVQSTTTTRAPLGNTISTTVAAVVNNSTSKPQSVIPHGYIFSAFMISVMAGSCLFKIFESRLWSVENFMRFVMLIAAFTLAAPVYFPQNQMLIYFGFLIFEVCVGIFWPAMSTLRGKYIPEEARATIMNYFRIPLNLIVVCILLLNIPMIAIFSFCFGCLLLASLTHQYLYMIIQESDSDTEPSVEQELKQPLTAADEKEIERDSDSV